MTDDRRFMAHEKEFAENTHGTSQRRGLRGDPWRRELRESPIPTRPDTGHTTGGWGPVDYAFFGVLAIIALIVLAVGFFQPAVACT